MLEHKTSHSLNLRTLVGWLSIILAILIAATPGKHNRHYKVEQIKYESSQEVDRRKR